MGIRAEKFAPIHEREDTEFYVRIFEKSYAEIHDAHMAEKYLARKHMVGSKKRKNECGKSRRFYDRYDSTREKFNCGNSAWRNISRAEILAEDWRLEEYLIAEDIEKSIAEFLKLNDWLKYA